MAFVPASKWMKMRLPSQFSGMSKVLRYAPTGESSLSICGGRALKPKPVLTYIGIPNPLNSQFPGTGMFAQLLTS